MAAVLKTLCTLSIFLGVTALWGCSLFSGQKDGESPLLREVPMAARKTDEPRKRVLVLPILEKSEGRSNQATEAARQALLRLLRQTDQFVLVSPSDIPKDLDYFKLGDEYNLRDLAPIAQGLGISAIVETKIVEIKARKMGDQVGLFREVKARVEGSIRLRLYSPKSNRELINELKTATVEASTTRVGAYAHSDRFLEDDPQLVRDVVSKAIQGFVPTIVSTVRKLSWEGRVAMVSGDRIYVNAGRLSGIQIGDILKIMDTGDEVFDPETGDLIGRAPGRMKGTIEMVTYFGKDGAIGVIHSGAGFKENDQVELY